MAMDIQKANSGNLAYSTALPPVPMPPLVHNASPRHKELADRLRGDRSYKEHYAYLLDWYANDRNGFPAGGKSTKDAKVNVPSIAIADNHVKHAFNDVLESIKHLDRKIDRVSAGSEGSGIKAEKTRRAGNIFTRLVERRA